MNSMELPFDIARCEGVGDETGTWWREGCEDCLRRTDRPKNGIHWMHPPKIITFECEYRIDQSACLVVMPPVL